MCSISVEALKNPGLTSAVVVVRRIKKQMRNICADSANHLKTAGIYCVTCFPVMSVKQLSARSWSLFLLEKRLIRLERPLNCIKIDHITLNLNEAVGTLGHFSVVSFDHNSGNSATK